MVMNTRAKTQTTQQGRTKEKHFPTNIEGRGPTALQTRVGNWKCLVGIGGSVDKSVFFFQHVMPWGYT
jgi:hypothetical protein